MSYEEEDETFEHAVLLVIREVSVFKIPPRPTSGGYKCGEWMQSGKIWFGRLRIISCDSRCEILLEDPNSGDLFAACFVNPGQREIVVEPMLDSSRYFVLRTEDGHGKHVFVGLGFNERNEVFDFNMALSDHEKYVKKEVGSGGGDGEGGVDGHIDIHPAVHHRLKGVNENDIHKIVLSYLVHNCFKDTLESFVACTGEKQPVCHLEDMEKRKRIYNFALDGNASKAIELTEEFAPGLLDKNKDLHFDLLILQFVELVCSRKIDEALGFAQSKCTPFVKEQKYVQKLEDFIALLAYAEPEKSPMFHLLSSEHKECVADSLNRAILAHTKLPSYSAMERLIQQTTVVRQYLSQEFSNV